MVVASAEFDFAVMVFTPDDVIESRKKVEKAPRDNVVFELGLFLSRPEGPQRTFVIAPYAWKTGLRI
jgi:predicted nucleotide-binding protein